MEKYKRLIESIQADLKGNGFTKSGSIFYINKFNNWGLISFQKSRHSDPDQIEFTIELGVCSEKIGSFLGRSIVKPKIEECHWRVRIGELMEKAKDYWWEINSETDFDNLYREIKDLLIAKGIPNLLANISDESLEKTWLAGVDNGSTKFERLIYLSTLLKLYNRQNLKDVAMELRLYSIDKPIEDAAENHIRKLKVDF